MKMLVLDVGCGRRPRGNVNVDVRKEWPEFMFDPWDGVKNFDLHKIPNFVLASACKLPFRTKTFDKIVSFSVLEHIETPFQALKEIIRVCKGEANIYVPHRFGWSAKHRRGHVSLFNATWFKRAFEKLGILDYKIRFGYKCFPHPYMPFFTVPRGINVWFHVGFQQNE